jgi:hypothetical protein
VPFWKIGNFTQATLPNAAAEIFRVSLIFHSVYQIDQPNTQFRCTIAEPGAANNAAKCFNSNTFNPNSPVIQLRR